MISLTGILFRCNSRRLQVRLSSCVHSGYIYMTRVSPYKSRHRIVLHKYDPRVNKHVLVSKIRLLILIRLFYQTAAARTGYNTSPPSRHSVRYARLIGKAKNMKTLIGEIQKAYEHGRFNAFDSYYNTRGTSRGIA
ncbi:hypothetical protein, conserved [Babesia bigemina]|uniref:50S ribosomal protein L33 n=1 Tax=Babesia bigemina TaxID=5866 RepID=A0A061D5U3_BABBI|nr:hypothetical protein, conserved [Babesia bigemina]CDR95382.1 hypothetical protein, conserved [Babesia bigemina]|eukprot:XP_012767568.1 hypothetical protein, conserved [Babesia bigemina]